MGIASTGMTDLDGGKGTEMAGKTDIVEIQDL